MQPQARRQYVTRRSLAVLGFAACMLAIYATSTFMSVQQLGYRLSRSQSLWVDSTSQSASAFADAHHDSSAKAITFWREPSSRSATSSSSMSKPQPARTRHNDHCGHWQEEYTALHKSILAGQAAPAYAIAETHSGLADALVGLVTIFYFALLTGRAFQVHMVHGASWGNHMEWGFGQPNINWTYTNPKTMPDKEMEAWVDPTLPEHEVVPAFWEQDLNLWSRECEVLRFGTFYGMSTRLFTNPHHRRQLLDMGLHPDTAFGCAMDYLFEPLPVVKEMFKEEHEVMSNPDTLKIGIQIRTNDTILENQPNITDISEWDEYFRCAQDLEDYYALPGQKVVWLLVSDSSAVRRLAKERHEDKIVTNLKVEVVHIGDNRDKKHRNPENKRRAFMTAAGEIWLFRMADFHVISRFSGYGRSGAFWGRAMHSVYTINMVDHPNRQCGPLDYDSQRELATKHVGGWHPGI